MNVSSKDRKSHIQLKKISECNSKPHTKSSEIQILNLMEPKQNGKYYSNLDRA